MKVLMTMTEAIEEAVEDAAAALIEDMPRHAGMIVKICMDADRIWLEVARHDADGLPTEPFRKTTEAERQAIGRSMRNALN